MQLGRTIASVQPPVIPIVNGWIGQTPGTISLGQGMVAYPPPPEALRAAAEFGRSPEQHCYGPALGEPELLRLIAGKLRRENGIDVENGYRVMVTAGSNMAFLSLLLAIAEPGDEIILPSPYYFNQEMAVRMLNCIPVAVPTDARWQLRLDALAAAVTEKTRAIVTISPNNPTGAVYPETDLRAVNELCRRFGLYHISDEAYEYFVYADAGHGDARRRGVRHFSPGGIEGAQAHTVSLYSLSKAYGFAGWRVGYMVFPEPMLPALLKIQDTNLICPPRINQAAAAAALKVGSAYCRDRLENLKAMRRRFAEALRPLQERKLAALTLTEGAFYLMVKLDTARSDLELVQDLIRRFQIAAIPGSAFGLREGCHLRLSYGMLDPDQADAALQRLREGLQDCLGQT